MKKWGPLDVLVSVDDPYNYPYTNLFKLRHSNRLVGKIIQRYTNNQAFQYPIVSHYYITE